MPLFLNYCRLICNAALPRLPKKVPGRIYLSGIFITFFTFQGIFQGKLSSLLTKDVHRPNINTMSDLANAKHTVYGHTEYPYYFGDHRLAGRFVEMEGYNCRNYVLHDSLAACIRDDMLLIYDAPGASACTSIRDDMVLTYDASGLNLHLSNDLIVNLHIICGIRDD